MIQYVCDRCGKPIDNEALKKDYATYEIRKRRGGSILESPLDLCPGCYKSFSDWLKVRKAESEKE